MKHFDFIAPIYNRLFGNYLPTDRWIELLKLPVEGSLLDAAGGTGRVSIHLSNYVKKVIIADLSSGMLSQTHREDRTEAVRSNVAKLPFGSGSFDRIIMVDAFHHISEQQRTIGELWRVLKLGGILLIEEPDINTIGVKFMALLERLLLMRSHFAAVEDIVKLFRPFASHVEVQNEGAIMWVQVTKTGLSTAREK